jgi:hypothetical protein
MILMGAIELLAFGKTNPPADLAVKEVIGHAGFGA